ncbi:LamG-like jellyroll fold domain-containing protein [uncultured Thiodictyon sp.]|uniref:LamG-like jellyroll fold domain-containing protein n=1 Tax=uncultured Thiodictyon sp. TaxID=1846217 RepID=UPI0025CCE0B9|nr:LamG-like jellyroll fold domain-containing protein [uncultured Thiodictyon sp.]
MKIAAGFIDDRPWDIAVADPVGSYLTPVQMQEYYYDIAYEYINGYGAQFGWLELAVKKRDFNLLMASLENLYRFSEAARAFEADQSWGQGYLSKISIPALFGVSVPPDTINSFEAVARPEMSLDDITNFYLRKFLAEAYRDLKAGLHDVQIQVDKDADALLETMPKMLLAVPDTARAAFDPNDRSFAAKAGDRVQLTLFNAELTNYAPLTGDITVYLKVKELSGAAPCPGNISRSECVISNALAGTPDAVRIEADGSLSFVVPSDGRYVVLAVADRISGKVHYSIPAPLDVMLRQAAPDSLLGYWSFDACDAADDSGNGLNGAIVGSPACVAGKQGKALRLNGSADWVSVAGADAFPRGALTIAYWVNREGQALTGPQDYVYKEGAFRSSVLPNGQFNSGLWKGTPGDWSAYPSGAVNLAVGDGWVFYAWTYDNATATAKTYLNGELVQTAVETDPRAVLRQSSAPLLLGRNGNADAPYAGGLLDEVRLYGRALSAKEIGGLYSAAGGAGASDLEVIAWGDSGIERTSAVRNLRFKALAAGANFNLGLKQDGTVFAWGMVSALPTDLSGVKAIDLKGASGLAIKEDGTVVAWGPNTYGESTVPTGLGGVKAIGAGAAHSLALKDDGTVVAWGYNRYGQSTVPPGLSGVRAVAAGLAHSLALKEDGTVVAWGRNSYGESTVPPDLTGVKAIAAGVDCSLALKGDGTVVAWGDNSYGKSTVPSGLSGVKAITAGDAHSLALKEDGTVVGWGLDGFGQSTVPSGLSGVVAVTAGSGHNLALKDDGSVVAWGWNMGGQSTVPPDLNGVKAIATGHSSGVALSADGVVFFVGDNYVAHVDGSQNGLRGIKAITASFYHRLALKDDGTVWSSENAGVLAVPPDLTGVKAIAAGYQHDLALKEDGTVVAWGQNTYGESTVPPDLSGVKAVAAGEYHSLALKEDGTVIGWGQSTVPNGLSGVTAIAAGGSHGLALKQDGTVVAWGANGGGQLNVPSGLSGVKAIAAGHTFSLALKEDGTVVAWGQSGVGAGGQSTVPAGVVNVKAIAAGGSRSMVIGKIIPPPLPPPPSVRFLSENLPDGTYQVGAATKQWRFKTGAVPVTGLKAVGVSADAALSIGVSEIALGDIAAETEFLVTLPINPQRAPGTLSSVWKLVDGGGQAVTINNSPSNTFWLRLRTNRPPVFSSLQLPAFGGLAGAELSLPLLGQDPDADPLTFAVVSGGGTVDGNTYRATFQTPGVHDVSVRVSDGLESREQMLSAVVLDAGGLARFYADVAVPAADSNGAYAAIHYLATKGIVIGCGTTAAGQRNFCPDQPTTQAEGLKMLLSAARERGFVTLDEGNPALANLWVLDDAAGAYINNTWAAPYAATAERLGMIDAASSWDPAAPVTRQVLARWLERLLDLAVPTGLLEARGLTAVYAFPDAASFVDDAAYRQAREAAFFGYLGQLGAAFLPGEPMTRGDFAVVAAKVLRTPTMEGPVLGGTVVGERFGRALPVITQGQTLTVEGVRGLRTQEILMVGDLVKEDWLEPADNYVRVGVALLDGTSLAALRYVRDLASQPLALDTGTLDLKGNSLLTLAVFLESRAPEGSGQTRANVIKVYYVDVAVDVADRDNDGVRDDLDPWPDDWRFRHDQNHNGLPDNLETLLGALGRDGNQPALLNGQAVGYTLFDAIIGNLPNDLAGFALQLEVTGLGTVTSSPAGIACGSDCRATFRSGAAVTLSASPDDGNDFAGWGGACVGASVCVVDINAATQVTATFMIGKANQRLVFGLAPTIVVGATGRVTATGGGSGNPIIFSSQTTAVCTTSGTNGSTVTGVAVGTCIIAAAQAGNVDYNAAQLATQSFVIGQFCSECLPGRGGWRAILR